VANDFLWRKVSERIFEDWPFMFFGMGQQTPLPLTVQWLGESHWQAANDVNGGS
jgi:hypothetical protein